MHHRPVAGLVSPPIHIQVILLHLPNGPFTTSHLIPSPIQTTFLVLSFSFLHLFHSNYSWNTSRLPPPTLIQSVALELTTCPRALIYEKGGAPAKLSYQNRPVFHPFIWHLKSNYTNMLHCKTRAHCSKFRFYVLSVTLWPTVRGQKAEKHFCQSNDIFMYWYKSSNEMYSHNSPTVLLEEVCTNTKYKLCYKRSIQYWPFFGEDFSVNCICVY